MSKLCPECGEPPHYHSFCTLCAQLFFRSRWRHLAKTEREIAFRREYFRCGSAGKTAISLGMPEMTAYDWRKRLKLPIFPPDGRRWSTWTSGDDVVLADAIAAGLTRKEAAAKLKRSITSIAMRRGVLGLPNFKRRGRPRQYRPLTDQVKALRRAGYSYSEAARKLKVTRNVIAGVIRDHIREAEPA